jgi:uncharacterized protein
MLEFKLFTNVESYKRTVVPFLEQDQVVNNLALGILLTVTEKPTLMATVTRNNDIIFSLLQTSPKQIILSKTDLFVPEEIVEVAKLLNQNVRNIPGLVGEKNITNQLAKELTLLRNDIPSIQMNQRLYKLEKVVKKPLTDGRLVKMTIHNLSLIADWVYQFCMDIDESISRMGAEIKATDLLEKGRVYGWEVDGEIISMANAARPTKSNITINFVYTPIEERKKGYASSCVSALSELMLHSGFRSTSLYTDLANPTSNKIYMEIGYKPIMDSMVIHFN